MSGFDLQISVADPLIADITDVILPEYVPSFFASLFITVDGIPGPVVDIAAIDLNRVIEPHPPDLGPDLIATLQVELLSPGETQVFVSGVPRVDDDSGESLNPQSAPGTLTVTPAN